MDLSGKTALLVEDEDSIRLFLGRYLHRLGMDVIEAEDGIDALKHLNNGALGLIVTDLHMPRMDGVKFISEVRASGSIIPILAITGGEDSLEMKALSVGACLVVHKPLFRMKFLDAVERITSCEFRARCGTY